MQQYDLNKSLTAYIKTQRRCQPDPEYLDFLFKQTQTQHYGVSLACVVCDKTPYFECAKICTSTSQLFCDDCLTQINIQAMLDHTWERDSSLYRELSSLERTFFQKASTSGCSFKECATHYGKFTFYEDLLRHYQEGSCPGLKLDCVNNCGCSVQMTEAAMAEHFMKECSRVAIGCSRCKASGMTIVENSQHSCSGRVALCQPRRQEIMIDLERRATYNKTHCHQKIRSQIYTERQHRYTRVRE